MTATELFAQKWAQQNLEFNSPRLSEVMQRSPDERSFETFLQQYLEETFPNSTSRRVETNRGHITIVDCPSEIELSPKRGNQEPLFPNIANRTGSGKNGTPRVGTIFLTPNGIGMLLNYDINKDGPMEKFTPKWKALTHEQVDILAVDVAEYFTSTHHQNRLNEFDRPLKLSPSLHKDMSRNEIPVFKFVLPTHFEELTQLLQHRELENMSTSTD